MLSYLIAKALCLIKARRVFLCGDDKLGLRQVGKLIVNTFDVFLLELMVVAEGHREEMGRVGREIVDDLLWRGNTSQEQDVLVG